VRSNDPLHPVTFGRGGAESYAAVATLSVPGEGRPLSLMVRATADGLVAYSGAGQRADFLALELVDAGRLRLVAGPAAAVVSAAGSLADGRWHTVELAVEQVPAAGGRRSRHRRATPTRALLTMLVDNRPVQAASLVNKHTHTHTHTHPFNGFLSGTTRMSRYQKGKTNLDFTEARDSEWQWHQLGHMQVCTSLQTDNHANTPTLSFFRPDALPAAQPTASKH